MRLQFQPMPLLKRAAPFVLAVIDKLAAGTIFGMFANLVLTQCELPQTQIAALPGVLYETLAHASDIENTIPRRMVLASRFRGSGLRLPLSGLACAHIATTK